MRLVVLGSSSSGNGYLLISKTGDALIIETGIRLMKVKEALNFDIERITGALISHSHKDHSGRTVEYLMAGIKCYTSAETISELTVTSHNLIPVADKITHYSGPFSFMPFSLIHDVKCYGYLVRHSECGQFVFITDTLYANYKFKGVNHIIVEANYSEEILDENLERSRLIPLVRNRVISSHMSFSSCKKFLSMNNLHQVRNIILIHLSSSNSNAPEFTREIERLTGKKVYVASPGLNINLDLTPF
jgi:phosphoribosyl 1,2-cyclic phosphodiesterase